MSDITLYQQDGRLYVEAPYDADAIQDYKDLSGRWDPSQRAWHFSPDRRSEVIGLLVDHFDYVEPEEATTSVETEVSGGRMPLMPWGSIHITNFGQMVWNPLVAEMMAAASMYEHTGDDEERRSLTRALGLAYNSGEARDYAHRVIAYLIGMTRVGEAVPRRMNEFGLGSPVEAHIGWETTRRQWWDQAQASGLPVYPLESRLLYVEPEHVTAAALPRLSGCDCEDVMTGEYCLDHAQIWHVAMRLTRLAGQPVHAEAVNRSMGGADRHWDPVREAMAGVLAAHVGVDRTEIAGRIQPESPKALAWLHAPAAECNALVREVLSADRCTSPSSTDAELSVWAQRLAEEPLRRVRDQRRG